MVMTLRISSRNISKVNLMLKTVKSLFQLRRKNSRKRI